MHLIIVIWRNINVFRLAWTLALVRPRVRLAERRRWITIVSRQHKPIRSPHAKLYTNIKFLLLCIIWARDIISIPNFLNGFSFHIFFFSCVFIRIECSRNRCCCVARLWFRCLWPLAMQQVVCVDFVHSVVAGTEWCGSPEKFGSFFSPPGRLWFGLFYYRLAGRCAPHFVKVNFAAVLSMKFIACISLTFLLFGVSCTLYVRRSLTRKSPILF